MVDELRHAGYPFNISVAVSPFKYTEPDCMYQYLKLEKKIAAGANFAITQLGYDSKKFYELKRYLKERGLEKFPVFGNVYILSAPAAKKFAKGEPPGAGHQRSCATRWSRKRKHRPKTKAWPPGWSVPRRWSRLCGAWATRARTWAAITIRSGLPG